MSDQDALHMERDIACMDKDEVIAWRQEIKQWFIEIRVLCSGPSNAFAQDLVRSMERDTYDIDLYEAKVPPKRRALNFSQARNNRSQTRTHGRTVSTKGVEQPRRLGPYDQPHSGHRSSRSQHHVPAQSGHDSSGSSGQGHVLTFILQKVYFGYRACKLQLRITS